MRQLYHFWLSPFSRKVRLVLAEKKLEFELKAEPVWERRDAFLSLNPAGEVPVLEEEDGTVLCDSTVICEYLDGLNDPPVLIPRDPAGRVKTLHLAALADGLMDVTVGLYLEKLRHPQDLIMDFVTAQEETIARCLAFYEQNTARLETLSIASIAAGAAVGYLNFRLGDLNPAGKYPQMQAWFNEFSLRPSMKESMPVSN